MGETLPHPAYIGCIDLARSGQSGLRSGGNEVKGMLFDWSDLFLNRVDLDPNNPAQP